MVIIVTGATHSGKTAYAQKLLEKHKYPYLSIDHLKMGLIRSGKTNLTPMDDEELTEYLWPILREIIKTAIENEQNLVIEGSYIPFDWEKDFEDKHFAHMRFDCLILSRSYIMKHYDDILAYANVIEKRQDTQPPDMETLIAENEKYLALCRKWQMPYTLIEEEYRTW